MTTCDREMSQRDVTPTPYLPLLLVSCSAYIAREVVLATVVPVATAEHSTRVFDGLRMVAEVEGARAAVNLTHQVSL